MTGEDEQGLHHQVYGRVRLIGRIWTNWTGYNFCINS